MVPFSFSVSLAPLRCSVISFTRHACVVWSTFLCTSERVDPLPLLRARALQEQAGSPCCTLFSPPILLSRLILPPRPILGCGSALVAGSMLLPFCLSHTLHLGLPGASLGFSSAFVSATVHAYTQSSQQGSGLGFSFTPSLHCFRFPPCLPSLTP